MSNIIKIIDQDIIFLSYDEPNAEKNYADLLSKFPWAKRVHGVEGKAWDGTPADDRRREKPRRGRSFGGHARAIEGDCGIRRLRRVIGDAELTG